MNDQPRPAGLIPRYREELQARHYARRTVNTYEQWLRRFLRFHGMRHPREMGSAEVNAFLTHLAVEGQASTSTQNQALSALLFLYRELLERDLDQEGVVGARKPRRLPVVLTEEEVRLVLQRHEGSEALVAGLLYGSGLRLMEALRLRVQDLDFNRQELTVRDGKGGKDRRTMLPKRLSKKLQIQLEEVLSVHKRDLKDGWMGCRATSLRIGTKASECCNVVALAGSNLRTTRTPSSRSEFDSKISAERCAGSWHQQAG